MEKSEKQRFKEAIKGKNKLGLFKNEDTKETNEGLRILGTDARIFGFKLLREALKRKGLFAEGLRWDSEFVFVRNLREISARWENGRKKRNYYFSNKRRNDKRRSGDDISEDLVRRIFQIYVK